MSYQDILLFKIETKREEMILTAAKTGIASNQTLLLSRELDDLLNIHNKKTNESQCFSPVMAN